MSVESTQDCAFALAASGAQHGTVVRAEYQRAGRGRQGRRWEVPAGTSLMFSVVLRPTCPPHQLGHLSLQAGLALAMVFEHLLARPLAIKWPNDVLIADRKVSGVLLQVRGDVAVLGMGVNVNQLAEMLPSLATSLALETGCACDRDQLFDDVIAALNASLTLDAGELPPHQVAAIEERLWLSNRDVTLLDGDRSITGRIAGIDPTGALRLVQNGVERMVRAGEITRGPRADAPDPRP